MPLRRIEGIDRQAGLRVDTISDRDTRLGGAADTVFGRQQGNQCQVVLSKDNATLASYVSGTASASTPS